MNLSVDHLGASYGQHDYEMRVTEGEECAGVLSFSEFEGVPHVNWIEVAEGHARRGIAATMIRNLQSRYPRTPIDFGYATSDGSAFIDSLALRIEQNPAHVEAAETARRCRTLIEGFERSYERLKAASESERDGLMVSLEAWNEVSDALEDAERILAQQPESLRFVVIETDDQHLSELVMHP